MVSSEVTSGVINPEDCEASRRVDCCLQLELMLPDHRKIDSDDCFDLFIFQASNSASYIQDALQLLLPVLELSHIQACTSSAQ